MDIGKWVIVHRLLKVDGVENLDGVAMLQKGVAALNHDAAFREDPVNDFFKKIQPFPNKKAPGNRFSNQEPWKYSVLLTLRHHRMDSYASHPPAILKSSPGHRYPNS